MNKHVKIIPEKIAIRNIRILGGLITAEPNNPSFDTRDIEEYQIQFGITDELFYQEKTFRFVFSVRIEAKGPKLEQIKVKGEYSIEYVFHIENFEDYVEEENENDKIITIHPILLNTLVSIIYSTTRGIVLSRTQGTALDGVILPVVDSGTLVNSLIKKVTSEVKSNI